MKKIRIGVIKSSYVCSNSEIFLLMIGHKHFNLGFQIQDSNFRIMLIWWHICLHY
jgi:hypothetical protein